MGRSGLIAVGSLAVLAVAISAFLFLRATSAVPASVAATAAAAMDPAAVVNDYCVVCHNAALQTGGLDLSPFDPTQPALHAEVWERVLRKLRAGAMPPTGLPRPEPAVLAAFESHLVAALDQANGENPDPGRTASFQRLSRLQYQNAVRDLLALEVDVTDLLPKDDVSYGFDSVNLTNLSPALMERYLGAAQKISRLAVGSELPGPASHVQLVEASLTQEDTLDGLPFGTRGGTAFTWNFPRDGEYRLDVVLARDRNENIEGLNEPHEMEISVDGERVGLFEIVPNRSQRYAEFYYSDQGAGEGLTATTAVSAGPHEVTVTFLKKNSALLESTRQPYIAHFNRDRHPREQPAVYSVAIGGPLATSTISSTPSRQRLFSCIPGEELSADACADQILTRLAGQAYRRPVTAADVEPLLGFFATVNASDGFEAGIEMALRALLVSPEFLFRLERDPAGSTPGEVYAVSDLELASRLSFFLWSSLPDDELLQLAIDGRLRDPALLTAQVERMLAHPKAITLTTDFASQWLYLRNLDGVDPNTRLFPDFDNNLRLAMRRETEMLFQHIVTQDRPVTELLSANYTFLNERLARHYGIANVYGDHFRQVSLPADSPRAGLLGHGSMLTVTSYATRTSPVQRGKWVLDNVLGIPPPPPPDNVPALAENNSEVKVETMRERMAQHRANPVCAQCHQVMDPIGLVFENFDAIGRWREANSDEPPIDTAGNLPGGDPLTGITGLRTALLQNPDAFVGTMTEKLLTYALGRGLGYYDAPAVRRIVREAEAQDYRFSSLILGIVNSTPFQMRKVL